MGGAVIASFFVAGPCELHVGVGSGGALAFLGWSESGVRVSNRSLFEDVKADISGPLQPGDVQLMGEESFVSCDLKVFNWLVWEAISSRAGAKNVSLVPPGFLPAGGMGALMIGEGLSYRLLVYRPYGLKTQFLSRGMRPAYNFLNAYLLGPDDSDNSVRAMKIRTVFRSIPTYNPADGSFTNFNGDYTGKPAAS